MTTDGTILIISGDKQHFVDGADLAGRDLFQLRFAVDPMDAFLKIQYYAPDLVITELAAYSIDGLQMCRQLRSDPDLHDIPIVVVGDLCLHSAIVADAFRCGADMYLQKPIVNGQLVNVWSSLVPTAARGSSASRLETTILFTELEYESRSVHRHPSPHQKSGAAHSVIDSGHICSN
jgi:PleD family two-component response regulator